MKMKFQNEKLAKLSREVKPWALFIGILFALKVTGALSGISFFANTALMKTGALDIQPSNSTTTGEDFNYDFTLKDLKGNTVDVKDLKGKVIFLNMWATWCGPCRIEMPSIQKLYNSVDQKKIAFIMLSLDQEGQHEKIVQYVEDKEFTFPVYQPASPLPKILRVTTIPTTFIIGADGKVKSKKVGTANYDTEDFKKFLKEISE
ncbi:MAG: TlpA disulfide reductase family protein [Cyclobacteriaceae bacterium]